MNKSIISFTMRFVLGLNFFFVSIAHLKLWKFYIEDENKITSWITNISPLGNSIAIGFLIASLFLLSGYRTIIATFFSIILLLVNHIILLFTNPSTRSINGPFYNSFHHSVPFLGFCVILLYSFSSNGILSLDKLIEQKKDELQPETKNEITLLIARIFVGTIFLSQGLSIFMKEGSIIQFAENVYVKSYESTFIPNFMLWFMGLANPFILLVGGTLLTIGLKIRWTTYILALFMISIVFGHLIGDPYETTGDISMYGFNNLAFLILILWLEYGKNKYSIVNIIRNYVK